MSSNGSAEKAERIFQLAHKHGQWAEILQSVESQPDLCDAVDKEGCSLLHFAAGDGDVAFAQKWLAMKRGPDVCCGRGQTPLMWAISKGKLEACRVLLRGHANVEHSDNTGVTPFILASQNNQFLICLLLGSYVPTRKLLCERDQNGCTALHWVAYFGHLDGLCLFTYFDTNINAVDNLGFTALHRAIMNTHMKHKDRVVKLLLAHDADVSVRDSKGRNCSDLAAELRQDSTCRLIKESLAPRTPTTLDRCRAWLLRRAYMISWCTCVVLCVTLHVFFMRDDSWRLASLSAAAFEIGTPLMLLSFLWSAHTDPGILAKGTKHNCGVEDLMALLRSSDTCSEKLSFGRLCVSTWILKGLRTKYCTKTGACIQEFDHFCVWMNSAVGRGNHRMFVLHTFVQCVVLLAGAFSCFILACEVISLRRESGDGVFAVIGALVFGRPLFALVCVVYGAGLANVLPLVSDQLLGIFFNLTVNERINRNRYAHFWTTNSNGLGSAYPDFMNPFDKETLWMNCLDFWWIRTRELTTPQRRARTADIVADFLFGRASWSAWLQYILFILRVICCRWRKNVSSHHMP